MIPASAFEINDDWDVRLLAPFKELLKAEREIIVGPDDARRSELRSLIEEREAELKDDGALGALFDKYIDTLPKTERPQGWVQESHARVRMVDNLQAELDKWRSELKELKSRPVNKQAIFISTLIKAMYLLRRAESLLNTAGSVPVSGEGKQRDDESARLLELSKKSVNEIGFSNRVVNCLNNANITTVGELAARSEANMLKYRNFGKKSLNEIKEKLQSFGLKLGDAREDPSLAETTSTEGDDLQAGKRKELLNQLIDELSGILLGEKIPLEVCNSETAEIIIPANKKITKTLLKKLANNYDRLLIPTSPIRDKILEIIEPFKPKFEDLKDKRDEALDREDRGQDCRHWYNLSQLGKTVSITGSRHPIFLGFPNGVKSVPSQTWKEMYELVVEWLFEKKLLLPNDIPWKLKNYFWGKNLNTRLGSKDIVFRSRRFIRACGKDPAQFQVQLR